jgi:hypothetical protein
VAIAGTWLISERQKISFVAVRAVQVALGISSGLLASLIGHGAFSSLDRLGIWRRRFYYPGKMPAVLPEQPCIATQAPAFCTAQRSSNGANLVGG